MHIRLSTLLAWVTGLTLPWLPLVASKAYGAEAAKPGVGLALPESDEGMSGAGPVRRYDWFRSVWAQRQALWVQERARAEGAVVWLGDSITQGWGDDFAKWFPGVRMANRGISGDTSRGVLYRLQHDVLSLRPRAVVLLVGTNDLEEGAEPETVVQNVGLMLTAMARHDAAMPIVLCQVFPSAAALKRPAAKIRDINQRLAALVKGNALVTLLETWTLLANAEGDAKREEFPDLLHPNAIGYAKWAAAVKPILATLGILETEPDAFTPEPGFVSLFNGRDLTGWGYRVTSEKDIQSARNWQKSDPNAAAWPIVTKPETFEGLTRSSDGRYRAQAGRLIVATPAEGRRIQQLWTTREFAQDFVLRLQFRATPNADSGVFLRGPQLQCRDYPLAGPYKQLQLYKPQDWNDLEVTVKEGVAHCTCNGEVIEAALKLPASGPIGLEGDRGQMEYRRIRLQTRP